MAYIRISAQQKEAMMTLHLNELKFGLNTPLSTSHLRGKVELSVCKKLYSNHFLVALRNLATNGYLIFQPNAEKKFNAKENESIWQLTCKGRQFAETLHQANLTPKRRYIKRRPRKPRD